MGIEPKLYYRNKVLRSWKCIRIVSYFKWSNRYFLLGKPINRTRLCPFNCKVKISSNERNRKRFFYLMERLTWWLHQIIARSYSKIRRRILTNPKSSRRNWWVDKRTRENWYKRRKFSEGNFHKDSIKYSWFRVCKLFKHSSLYSKIEWKNWGNNQKMNNLNYRSLGQWFCQ